MWRNSLSGCWAWDRPYFMISWKFTWNSHHWEHAQNNFLIIHKTSLQRSERYKVWTEVKPLLEFSGVCIRFVSVILAPLFVRLAISSSMRLLIGVSGFGICLSIGTPWDCEPTPLWKSSKGFTFWIHYHLSGFFKQKLNSYVKEKKSNLKMLEWLTNSGRSW